jgi:hypothetical protein
MGLYIVMLSFIRSPLFHVIYIEVAKVLTFISSEPMILSPPVAILDFCAFLKTFWFLYIHIYLI